MQSEFYTQAEMDAKFKKRKRKVRKVKKPETVKADDLLPLEEDQNKYAALYRCFVEAATNCVDLF